MFPTNFVFHDSLAAAFVIVPALGMYYSDGEIGSKGLKISAISYIDKISSKIIFNFGFLLRNANQLWPIGIRFNLLRYKFY